MRLTPDPMSLVLLTIAALPALALPPEPPCPNARLVERVPFESWEIRVSRTDDLAGCLEIRRNGTTAFFRRTPDIGAFHIGNGFEEAASAAPIPVGTDITGLGKPNVVVAESTGGAHCCYILHVLELAGAEVREVAAIDVADAILSHFVDLDRDGVYEIESSDFTFAYWHTSFAESPAPRVVLRFRAGAYHLAADLMRTPPPSRTEVRRRIAQIRADLPAASFAPPLLWRTMLDLIYTGHASLAWEVASATFGHSTERRDDFLAEFCGQLANSPYFAALQPELKSAPCRFDPARGGRI